MDQQNPITNSFDQDDVQKNKDIAAMSYVWILSVFIYFKYKDSPFVRFHARQGITLFLLSLIVAFIPLIGKYLMLIVVAGMVLGFIHAAQGRRDDVPFIGKLSRGELTMADIGKMLSGIPKDIAGAFHSKKSTPANVASPPTLTQSQTPTCPESLDFAQDNLSRGTPTKPLDNPPVSPVP